MICSVETNQSIDMSIQCFNHVLQRYVFELKCFYLFAQANVYIDIWYIL